MKNRSVFHRLPVIAPIVILGLWTVLSAAPLEASCFSIVRNVVIGTKISANRLSDEKKREDADPKQALLNLTLHDNIYRYLKLLAEVDPNLRFPMIYAAIRGLQLRTPLGFRPSHPWQIFSSDARKALRLRSLVRALYQKHHGQFTDPVTHLFFPSKMFDRFLVEDLELAFLQNELQENLKAEKNPYPIGEIYNPAGAFSRKQELVARLKTQRSKTLKLWLPVAFAWSMGIGAVVDSSMLAYQLHLKNARLGELVPKTKWVAKSLGAANDDLKAAQNRFFKSEAGR